ncbi:DUF4238 domain-containing protein [Mesorhizobium sp. ZC-5]|uniref:DUF4238 domain-containing protein n=1 Tax=Mesorhizobium sp. ZC-5 TaxID=2986066 RepID=UPI0021E982BB|nr:DUF4238 domain-containing protein [Mesorhizobium sp. ZC-5]MCV3240426.1 DUF4238 domain-containing protein [Mesorhizobium sp. ZC-5]
MPRENQHYVPQFLLRNFCAEGKLHIFDKKTGREFYSNPRNVMGESDYNVVALKDSYYIDFELRFTHIENLAKPVFEDIIKAQNLSILTPETTATICCFFAIQHARSKASRERMSDLGNELRRRFPDVKTNDLPEFFSDQEYDKFIFLKFATEKLADLAAPLVSKVMVLLKLNCAGQIYISDNPLLLHNQQEFGPYGNIGLGVPGIEIYHPISPDLVLGLLCPTIGLRLKKAQAEASKSLNDLHLAAFRNPQGSIQAQLDHLKEVEEDLQRARHYYSMLFEKRLVPISKENLLFLNSLQLQSAYRFVGARRKDFAFAKQAIREKPHWKDFPRFQFG